MESSAIPLHFNTVRHLRAERLLEKYFDDFPYQCMTCGRRFNTRALLAMHHDTHYKNNMRRRKILNKEIVEEKTYRGKIEVGFLDDTFFSRESLCLVRTLR